MDPHRLSHPGEILNEEFLQPHHLNPSQLARRLDVPPTAITAIIKGQCGITGPMSKLLGRAFGMSEDFFANLQTRYELELATINAASDEKAAERLRRADELARELSVA